MQPGEPFAAPETAEVVAHAAQYPLGPPAVETESADLFDYALLRDYLGYVAGSLLRRKLIALLVLAACVGLAFLALRVLPKSYHVEAKLLAQRNQVIAALGNPGRNMPWDADAPTRAAAEIILRRDNLLALAKQTDLVANWERTRAPALRLKDAVVRALSHTPTEQEKLLAAVNLLEKRLAVTTGESTVNIAIDWPDALMAARLVEAAQQSFLEARHVSEISAISEAISILESHASLVRERVDDAADRVQKIAAETRAQRAPAAAVRHEPRPAETQEVARLNVMLEAKRRTIADLEDFRHRRIAELQAKLVEERTVYADEHPIIGDLKQQIEALQQQQSVQISRLRDEEQELVAQLTALGAAPGTQVRTRALIPENVLKLEGTRDDPVLENAKEELRFALAKYAQMQERVDSAHMELDAARAAFKFRYSVIRPAEVPTRPRKPNAALVIALGLFAGLFLGVGAAVLRDLKARRVVERWQVERQLGIPVLAEVKP